MNRSLVPAGLIASAALSAMPVRGLRAVRADAGGAASADARALFAQLNQAFEAFRSEHTQQLADLRRGQEDVVRNDKVERINASIGELQAAIDELNTRAAALSVGGDARNGVSPKEREYAQAFGGYFRTGRGENQVEALIQAGGIQAAMSIGSQPDGGYLAPLEWDRTITDALKLVSKMRQICRVLPISVGSFRKIFNDRNTSSGWVGETDTRNNTGNAQLKPQDYVPGELYANPVATQQLLDDALIDLASWLSGEVETEFAKQEGIAFINGDGVNKPKGVLQYTAGASHPLGAIAAVNSGDAANITADGIVSLVYDLPSEFEANAGFIMNRKTLGKVRLLKDSQGRYLWQPGLQAGQPSTLVGFPVSEMPHMPDVAANAVPVMFGDFMQGYLIIDRMGVRVLRDPFSAKPNVQFYTTKRVGGGVLNPQALRYHKISV